MQTCPCCGGIRNNEVAGHVDWHLCGGCGHRWRTDSPMLTNDYRTKRGRNLESSTAFQRKLAGRLNWLLPMVTSGMHILEVGCAEGALGEQLKRRVNVRYEGIEISADADSAVSRLDYVHGQTAANLPNVGYDQVVSFHVLEHISDISAEMSHWVRLLKPSGCMLIEVPNQAGHPLLAHDSHQEHLHQFTAASMTSLLLRSGLAVQQLSIGNFESPLYSDSLRVQARPALAEAARTERLVQRFKMHLPEPFIVWGIGGDFQNYVQPVSQQLPIVALIDSSPHKWGKELAGFSVGPFDQSQHLGLRVLIASLRFQDEIVEQLKRLGLESRDIVTLTTVFENAPFNN